MGWIEPRSNGYLARWRHNGEVVSVLCPSKSAARTLLAQVATDKARGIYVDPRGSTLTLDAWAEEWIAARPGVKPSTQATDISRLRTHITPALGSVPLGRLTQMQVRRWAADIATRRSPKTVRNCHGLLYAICQDAVTEGLMSRNPCVGTPLPEIPHHEMHFLTAPELDRLVTATPEHYRPLVVTLAGTGLRWGEAVGLRRRRVDVLAGRLEVVETLHEVNGRLTHGTPKTRTSRRVVTLSPRVVDVLIPLVIGDPDGPLFTTERGAWIRRHNFSRRIWHPAAAKAGLPADLRVHDLRHTHAAQLISAGVPLTAVARRLGHASIRVTSDVYGHLMPAVDDAVLVASDALLPDHDQTECPPGTHHGEDGERALIVDQGPDLPV